MKILVAVKRVIDFATRIQIKSDQTGIETANVKMSMNPFDAIAVEEAVRLKEKGIAKEIIAISIGEDSCQETLRTALAMGADRAILVRTSQEVQPLLAAKIFKTIAQQENPQLIILGKQAIDTDNNQTGQMLAGLLNWPQGTFASKLIIENERAIVTREIDGGLETISLTLPAVVTTDLRLNEPRYLSLPNIVQAKRKTITSIPLEDLKITFSPNYKIIKLDAPQRKRSSVRVNSASELLNKLKTEAKVIS